MLGRGWVRPTKFTSNWKCSAHGTFRKKIHSGTETWLEWVTLGESLCGAVVCRNKWTRVLNKGLYSSWDKVRNPDFICSLCDLLGFAAHETIAASALLQDIWKAKSDWDEPLEEGFLPLPQLRLPRCYFPREMGGFKCKLQLHISSDRSEVGYGTSVYVRVDDLAGFKHCSLVKGKARNAPFKFVSIPRLELQSAVASTRKRC